MSPCHVPSIAHHSGDSGEENRSGLAHAELTGVLGSCTLNKHLYVLREVVASDLEEKCRVQGGPQTVWRIVHHLCPPFNLPDCAFEAALA